MSVYGSRLIILFAIKTYDAVINIIFMDYLLLCFILLLKIENMDIRLSRERSMEITSLSQRYRVMSLNGILHKITQ